MSNISACIRKKFLRNTWLFSWGWSVATVQCDLLHENSSRGSGFCGRWCPRNATGCNMVATPRLADNQACTQPIVLDATGYKSVLELPELTLHTWGTATKLHWTSAAECNQIEETWNTRKELSGWRSQGFVWNYNKNKALFITSHVMWMTNDKAHLITVHSNVTRLHGHQYASCIFALSIVWIASFHIKRVKICV